MLAQDLDPSEIRELVWDNDKDIFLIKLSEKTMYRMFEEIKEKELNYIGKMLGSIVNSIAFSVPAVYPFME